MYRGGGRGGYSTSSPRGRGRSPHSGGGRSPHFHTQIGGDGSLGDDSFGSSDGMSRGGRTYPQQRSQDGGSKHFEQKPSSGYRYGQKQPAYGGNAGVDGSLGDDSFGGNDGMSRGGRTYPQQRSQDGISKHFEQKPSSGYRYGQKQPAYGGNAGFSSVVRLQQGQSSPNLAGSSSKPYESVVSVSAHEDDRSVLSVQSDSKGIHLGPRRIGSWKTLGDENGGNAGLHLDFSDKVKIISPQNVSRSDSKFSAEDRASINSGSKNTAGSGDSGHSEQVEVFNLCPEKKGTSVMLKPSLLATNREKRNEIKRSIEGQNGSLLRPGMVLLKNFISFNDQVKIVKQCHELGKGTGGFYQPGYGDGRELHLKMMCLGKNWDPETSKYGDIRPHDHATPPKIPDFFSQLVGKAIEDSHALIEKNSKKSKARSVENAIPSMSPNICIVNFYTATGRLGLHQDKDESPESLRKGLPVVSFSIGDSAEFLYGDERDVDKAQKVVLESGDLLIFGGKSRHVFHGVTAILPNTASKVLLEETNLRPGRLNLTFREY